MVMSVQSGLRPVDIHRKELPSWSAADLVDGENAVHILLLVEYRLRCVAATIPLFVAGLLAVPTNVLRVSAVADVMHSATLPAGCSWTIKLRLLLFFGTG